MTSYIKKVITYLLNKFVIVILGALVPFILIFKKYKNFCFGEIYAMRIGSLCTAVEVFIRKNEFNTSKEKLLYFIYSSKPISNKFLLNLYIRKMKLLHNIKILKGYLFWKYLSKSYEFWTGDKILKFINPDRKEYAVFTNKPSMLSFSEHEKEKALQNLSEFGINKDSKWVCVHNRDSAYLNWALPKNDWSYHDYRDWSIKDIKLASEHFVKKGYFVIRVGKKTNEKMESSNPKIIDYINSEQRNDFNDIFLLSNCEFYFGSACGISSVPLIFRKPVFRVNSCPIEGIFAHHMKHPAIFKRVLDLETKKILTIKEAVNRKLCHLCKNEQYKKNKIKLVDNTQSEILAFAIEAESRVNQKWKSDSDFKEKSKNFSNEISKDSLIKEMYYTNPIAQEFLRNTQIN